MHSTFMTKEPLISILLCTYNGEKFLAEQLASLAAQTYKNLEFICSDNESTDASFSILKKWCEGATNKKLVVQKEGGLNKNFYHALNFASGEYIMFCDQDDVWLPQKIETMVSFMQKNQDISLGYCLSSKFSGELPPQHSIVKPAPRLEGSDVRKTLLTSFTLGHNIIISKEYIVQIPAPKNEVIAYDWWITIGAMALGKIKCCEQILSFWRQHDTNTTAVFNEPLFYESRLQYFKAFLEHPLINSREKDWTRQAISYFSELNKNPFSLQLFFFLLKSADRIYFYKLKKTGLRWVSFVKIAARMSSRGYRP